MHVSILTIFPELFTPFLDTSLIGRARAAKLLSVEVLDLRDFTLDPHRSVDDEPYGGGAGMVMTAEPWLRALDHLSSERSGWRVMLSPRGARLDDRRVRDLAARESLVLLCGRYEGWDERVRALAVDEEISIGDYVLAGGETAAMVVVEAVSRQLPGVVGDPESVREDSFRTGLLDYPQYTRPRELEGLAVPEVLLSGDHAEIRRWRRKEALRLTLLRRPDLLVTAALSPPDRQLLAEVASEEGLESLLDRLQLEW